MGICLELHRKESHPEGIKAPAASRAARQAAAANRRFIMFEDCRLFLSLRERYIDRGQNSTLRRILLQI